MLLHTDWGDIGVNEVLEDVGNSKEARDRER